MSNMFTDWEVRYTTSVSTWEQNSFFKCRVKAEEFIEAIKKLNEYRGHSFWVVTTAMEDGMVLCKTEMRVRDETNSMDVCN